jgi:hypothetical protein
MSTSSRFIMGLAPLAVIACTSTVYEVRQAPLGTPASPAVRAARVTVGGHRDEPGWNMRAGSSGLDEQAFVSPNGLEINDVGSSARTPAVLVSMRVQAGAGLEVRDAMWSRPSAPPCEGGHPALDLLVDVVPNNFLADDATIHWERPLVLRGDRVLTARFDEDLPLLREMSVVDLHVLQPGGVGTRETCVRVPATGPEVTFTRVLHWSLGGRLSARRSLAFSKSSVLTLAASIGRWVGPVRVGVEGLIGGSAQDGPTPGTGTSTLLCAFATEPGCDDVTVEGLSLEANGLAWRGQRWAVGWGVAYETLFADIVRWPQGGGPAAHRSAIAGGPRLELQLLRVSPAVEQISRYSPTSAWGLELFVAAAQEWRGSAAGSPATLGISLLGF